MRPSVDPRILAALVVAVMFVLMSNLARAGDPPSVVCGAESTTAEQQLCLVEHLADEQVTWGPATVFLSDAGPVVAVVVTAYLGFRMGRGL